MADLSRDDALFLVQMERLRRRAEALLEAGTLVWAPGETVAYAFVVPIGLRDDLAEALADLEDPG